MRTMKQVDEKHWVLNIDGLDVYFIRFTNLGVDCDYGWRISHLMTGSWFDVRASIDAVGAALQADVYRYRGDSQFAREVAHD